MSPGSARHRTMSVDSFTRIALRGEAAVALSTTLCRALGAAAERAADKLAERSGQSTADLRIKFGLISEAVCRHAEGDRIAGAAGGRPACTREMVDAFRVEFLARLNEVSSKRISGKELLAVLSAMDDLSRSEQRAAPGEFGEQMANSEALHGMLEIAHDMRSPLAAILLLVEPIRRGRYGPVTPVQERQLGLIYGAALSLSTLANDVIDAARGQRRANGYKRPFSISSTINDACTVVRPIAEEKQLELYETYPTVDGRIGDASAIHRVLLNLASNALKYTDTGSVSVGCAELDRNRVEFWVKDTGTGVPARVLSMLGDGVRTNPTGFSFSGSGLGLAICRALLETMGSSLHVETSPERGTRFSFVLDLPAA
mgnify:CR=1 FL=1